MKQIACAILTIAATLSRAEILVNQIPPQGGGTMRWSKLWIDPFGQNDYDSDAICYEDFTLSTPATIVHLEWWGDSNPDLGFQVEFWRQDPGTVAYQPLAVFRDSGAQPEAQLLTNSYAFAPDLGITHYSLDLSSPISLGANSPANPRWFIAIIARDSSSSRLWSWARGIGGSNQTFQWIRADGNNFHRLGEGRGLIIGGQPVPEPASIAFLALGALGVLHRRRRRPPAVTSSWS